MESLPLSLDDLRQLVSLFEEHRLTELEWREGGVRVRLQTAPPPSAVPVFAPALEEQPLEAEGSVPLAPIIPAEPSPEEKGWVALLSPMTGTFYRTPGPDEPNFVEAGDQVAADQTFGLIEAMKIFSEIPCETAGTVMEIMASNGQMVQPGQALAWILPD